MLRIHFASYRGRLEL